MLLTYTSLTGNEIYYNVQPIKRVKLFWGNQIFPSKVIVQCIYNNDIDYFFATELSSQLYNNIDIQVYVYDLEIIEITSMQESYNVFEIVKNKLFGTYQIYLNRKKFIDEVNLMISNFVGTTTTLSPITTSTTTTTPCPEGLVFSRVYSLNTSGECAICEPTNEFTCMANENDNKQSCEFNALQLNFLNPVCDTSPPPPL